MPNDMRMLPCLNLATSELMWQGDLELIKKIPKDKAKDYLSTLRDQLLRWLDVQVCCYYMQTKEIERKTRGGGKSEREESEERQRQGRGGGERESERERGERREKIGEVLINQPRPISLNLHRMGH